MHYFHQMPNYTSLQTIFSLLSYIISSYSCPDRCPIPAPGLYGCPSVTVLKYIIKLAENGPITVSNVYHKAIYDVYKVMPTWSLFDECFSHFNLVL